MTETDLARQLEGLFREVGEAHQPYIETDGAGPEWPLWYADYLRDELGTLLDADFTRSELLYLLVLVAHEQPLSAPGANWARYYAKFFTDSRVTSSTEPIRCRTIRTSRYARTTKALIKT